MDLSQFDEKHVRVKTRFGDAITGLARYEDSEYLRSEWGGKEDGIFIEDFLIYNSQIESIEGIEVHGTVELRTEHLILRRVCPEDAAALHQELGTDPAMYQYTGWHPLKTLETARETVRQTIERYQDEHFYSWVVDFEDVLFGIIGAYDFRGGRIEVGFSIIRPCWGRGYATEALKRVLDYLTENEGIASVTAWCAQENIASKRVLEKAGMQPAGVEKDGLAVGGKKYDKLCYEYRSKG